MLQKWLPTICHVVGGGPQAPLPLTPPPQIGRTPIISISWKNPGNLLPEAPPHYTQRALAAFNLLSPRVCNFHSFLSPPDKGKLLPLGLSHSWLMCWVSHAFFQSNLLLSAEEINFLGNKINFSATRWVCIIYHTTVPRYFKKIYKVMIKYLLIIG